jgi:hypothetical protein
MRMKMNGNKRDLMATVIYNAETTASIKNGQPVCLYMTGNAGGTDGLSVVLPSTAHNQNSGNEFDCLYGVALTNNPAGIPAGGYGEAQVFGFCADIAFTAETRSAATGGASWSATASIACWVPLIPETVGNGWTSYSPQSFVTGSASSIVGGFTFPQYQVLLTPYSVSTGSTGMYSIAASATNTSDTRTALFSLVKGYVRIM